VCFRYNTSAAAQYPYPAPPSQLTGGFLFAGTGGQPERQYDTDWTNIAPRIGVAWKITEKTVLRAGAGVYYQAPTQTGVVVGFNQSTPYTSSLDGQTPSAGLTGPYSLVNPFPNGLAPGFWRSLGLATSVGNGVSYDPAHFKIPRTYQYSFGFQRELPKGILVEASFAGTTRSISISATTITAGVWRITIAGFADNTYLNLTVPESLLRRAAAHFRLWREWHDQPAKLAPARSDLFGHHQQPHSEGALPLDAFQLKVEKRVLGGGNKGILTFGLAYTLAKAYEQNHRLNNWNTVEEPIYELDNTDKTHNFSFHGVWDLPFGKNRYIPVSNPVLGAVARDWTFDWILQYVNGLPGRLAQPAQQFAAPGRRASRMRITGSTTTRLAIRSSRRSMCRRSRIASPTSVTRRSRNSTWHSIARSHSRSVTASCCAGGLQRD
jgi:hypothetical protein